MTEFCGQHFELLSERALWWPAERALVLADVHLGKSGAFRSMGVPVPSGVTGHDLARLSMLIGLHGAERLLVLGDFLHARAGHVPELTAQLLQWRAAHPTLPITLIRGNHDLGAGDPAAELGIGVVNEPHSVRGLALAHHPDVTTDLPVIAGHIHPGTRLEDFDGSGLTVPCFVVEPRRLILPAFGRFTGTARVAASAERQLWACAAKRVVRVGVAGGSNATGPTRC